MMKSKQWREIIILLVLLCLGHTACTKFQTQNDKRAQSNMNAKNNKTMPRLAQQTNFSKIPEIAKWQSNRLLRSTNIIGNLTLPLGGNVRYFETLPGGRGKPRTLRGTKIGTIPVYETFDWKKVDTNLKGCHLWVRVSTNEEWMYAQAESNYTPR